MDKKKKSKLDGFIEQLANDFSKIKNIGLISTDPIAQQAFNTVTFRIADVVAYKDLVCSHFIPATHKAIFNAKQEVSKSKYNSLLQSYKYDFNETLYDTIRLAYVGLFHKLENYINEIVKLPELLFGEFYESEESVVKWAKEKYKFDIKDWQQFYIVQKINWICNCVKHKDGFPIKEPKPLLFINADINQKIRITPEEFKKDCELLLKFYPMYLQLILLFGQSKIILDKPVLKEDYIYSPGLYVAQVENVKNIDKQLLLITETIKKLK